MNGWLIFGLVVLFILWTLMAFFMGAMLSWVGQRGREWDEAEARERRARNARLN